MKRILCVFALFSLFLSAACAGQGGTEAEAICFLQEEAVLRGLGASLPLEEVLDVQPEGAEVTVLSDNEAAVRAEGGFLVAAGGGEATVTAVCGEISASLHVRVVDTRLVGLYRAEQTELTEVAGTQKIDGTYTISFTEEGDYRYFDTATYRDGSQQGAEVSAGSYTTTREVVSFYPSDGDPFQAEIAEGSEGCVLSGRFATAFAGNLDLSFSFGSKNPTVRCEGISLEGGNPIHLYGSQQISLPWRISVYPLNAADTSVYCMVSDENILSVSADGTLAALSEGKASLLFESADGGASAEYEVIVHPSEDGMVGVYESSRVTAMGMDFGMTLTLNADGTFTYLRDRGNIAYGTVDTGTYTAEGDILTLTGRKETYVAQILLQGGVRQIAGSLPTGGPYSFLTFTKVF